MNNFNMEEREMEEKESYFPRSKEREKGNE